MIFGTSIEYNHGHNHTLMEYNHKKWATNLDLLSKSTFDMQLAGRNSDVILKWFTVAIFRFEFARTIHPYF